MVYRVCQLLRQRLRARALLGAPLACCVEVGARLVEVLLQLRRLRLGLRTELQ